MTPLPSPRQRLEEWGRALPGLWRAIEAERARYVASGHPAPGIFLPLENAAQATVATLQAGNHAPPRSNTDLSRAALATQCLAAWRMTQGIYRIDPTLYAALIDTPVTGEIPGELLLRLPEWCVYIETPGMTVPLRDVGDVPVFGLWYWLDAPPDDDIILCIGIDTGHRPPFSVQHLPLRGTIEEALAVVLRKWNEAVATGGAPPAPKGYYEAAREWLPRALSLALYLCSTAAEIAGPGRPANPTPVRTRRRGERLLPADGPRKWDVGVRLGAALRAAATAHEAQAAQRSSAEGRHVRPHVRRAHWHTYLCGSRDAPIRELRWLPPIPVAVEDYDDLPSVIRTAGSNQ